MVALPQDAQALLAPGELQSSKLVLHHIYKKLQNLVKMRNIPIQPVLAKTPLRQNLSSADTTLPGMVLF